MFNGWLESKQRPKWGLQSLSSLALWLYPRRLPHATWPLLLSTGMMRSVTSVVDANSDITCPFFCGTVCLWFSGLRWAPVWILNFSLVTCHRDCSTKLHMIDLNPHCFCFPIASVSNTPIVHITPLNIWTFSWAVRCTTTARLLSADGWISSVVKQTVAKKIYTVMETLHGILMIYMLFFWEDGFYIPWLGKYPLQQIISTWWGCATQEALRALAETGPWGDPWYGVMLGGWSWIYCLVRGPHQKYASGIWSTEPYKIVTYHAIYLLSSFMSYVVHVGQRSTWNMWILQYSSSNAAKSQWN